MTRKLSRTQQETWDRIRHALPEAVARIDGFGSSAHFRDDTVHVGGNKDETLLAMQKAGYIEVVKLGEFAWQPDIVRPVKDLGTRTFRLEFHVKGLGCVYDTVVVDATSWPGSWHHHVVHLQHGESMADVENGLLAAGWTKAA